MSVGLLGSQRPTAVTDTVLYTCPASTKCAGTVVATNTGTATAKIRIGVKATSAAFTTQDWRVYDVDLRPSEIFNLSGFLLGASNTIKVYTDLTTVNFHFDGLEATV